ncbi:MAG TPA: FG-GAP-like repeat-containing protein [Chthoniobacterales bacterium]
MIFIRACASIAFVCSAACLSLQAADVLTYHNNLARTGLNPNETTLTPQNVAPNSFGLLRNLPVDGQVYAQPLYASNVAVVSGGQPRGSRNLVIVATENDSVYAFDADSGQLYWKTSVLTGIEVPADDDGCTDITPTNGVGATPVIDRTSGPNGVIYVLAMSADVDYSAYHFRLYGLDLATGEQVRTTEVQASVPGAGPNNDGNGHVVFTPQHERSRAGLCLANGILYLEWGSLCDIGPYQGWIIAYNENTFAQTAAYTPNANGAPPSTDLPDGSGSGIWQSGAPAAVDASGNLYLATANGPFDTNLNGSGFPTNGDYGDTFLKLSSNLQVMDYFAPFNQAYLAASDNDLASGGSMVLDVTDGGGGVHNLAFTGGKNGIFYVFNRNNLGKFNSVQDTNLQQIAFNSGVYSTPAYFNGSIYFSVAGGTLQQYAFMANATLNAVPASATATAFGYPGASASISASGTTKGIAWAIERGKAQAILHAYDATNLATQLYTSAGVVVGSPIKFAVPTVCNGKVFVGTANSVAVFGLLHPVNEVDLNGDGHSDLVFLNPGKNQVGAWLMNGNTILATPVLGAIPPQSRLVALADLANLGSSQLIWFNGSTFSGSNNYLAWATTWSVNDTPTTTATAFALPANYPVLVGVDLDGDGLVDAVQYNPATGALLIAKNNGGLSFTTQLTATVAVGWSLLGAADLNGDGSHQLLWRDGRTGAVGAWVMAGFQLSRTVGYGTAPFSWAVRGLGKVDATTAEGLIWQNETTGQVGVWKLNTNGQVTVTTLGSASLAWQVAANASLDGTSGVPEIVWTNPGSGQVGLWRFSGGTVSTVVLGNPSPAWTLQPTPQLH